MTRISTFVVFILASWTVQLETLSANSTTTASVTAALTTSTVKPIDINAPETRRRKKKRGSSTSSSSDSSSSSRSKESLGSGDLSSISWSDTDEDNKAKEPKRLKRKRRCKPCPEDMIKKWKDPSIQWICGAYQRARRSFKSICMMYYRNCQDGTMFTKLHDHRCANDSSSNPLRHGHHFFYEEKVKLSDESSGSSSESNSDSSISSDYY